MSRTKTFFLSPAIWSYALRRMNGMKCAVVICLALSAARLAPAQPARTPAPPVELIPRTVLAFDADLKQVDAQAGDKEAYFTFWVTNICQTNVSILNVTTSCGCTAASLPSLPWLLQPGENGPIKVTLDLRGRYGPVMKGVHCISSAGVKDLVVRANLPQAVPAATGFAVPGLPTNPPPPTAASREHQQERVRNLQVALGDRQAVFKAECVRCHAEPGRGKWGGELFAAVCGVCHEASPRAAMVPDLKHPRGPRSIKSLRQVIVVGIPGTLMPAFATAEGGPLTDGQIDSLAVYLEKNFSPTAVSSNAAPVMAPVNPTPAPTQPSDRKPPGPSRR
jgi:cytochrome c553